ncbi:TadE/TadG family type IV pilus assembly protein [Massilia sp. H6]|uniref:TadE/TadG family type IV pilus assembly protein n=1 Tax=Massilia sp. H6 TaxID=2970464 RepID=UPI00216A1D58|nr:TadE family protein [Massilia sp. H6]UVW26845.1 pilus assembly protein [Massilia sp. H6]
MSKLCNWRRRHREAGVAAVELALFMPMLVVLFAAPLFFGRVFLHYSMAQKAAHDAVRFLATAPRRDIMWYTVEGNEIGSAALARAIARAELGEANTGRARPVIDVFCDGETCAGNSIPSRVQVIVTMRMADVLFDGLTGAYAGDAGLAIRADVTMAYAGK